MSNAEKELERKKREEKERQEREAARRRAHIQVRSQYTIREVNPFNTAQPVNHGKVRSKGGGKSFSAKQANFIRRWCGKDPTQLPYGYGTRLIAEKMAEWDKRRAA